MTDIETVALFCQEHLNLGSIVRLGDEYAYSHLPLCFLDAVWSIGVRYQGVQRVVKRYEKWAGLGQPSSIHTTAEFLEKLSTLVSAKIGSPAASLQDRICSRDIGLTLR